MGFLVLLLRLMLTALAYTALAWGASRLLALELAVAAAWTVGARAAFFLVEYLIGWVNWLLGPRRLLIANTVHQLEQHALPSPDHWDYFHYLCGVSNDRELPEATRQLASQMLADYGNAENLSGPTARIRLSEATNKALRIYSLRHPKIEKLEAVN